MQIGAVLHLAGGGVVKPQPSFRGSQRVGDIDGVDRIAPLESVCPAQYEHVAVERQIDLPALC